MFFRPTLPVAAAAAAAVTVDAAPAAYAVTLPSAAVTLATLIIAVPTHVNVTPVATTDVAAAGVLFPVPVFQEQTDPDVPLYTTTPGRLRLPNVLLRETPHRQFQCGSASDDATP